MKATIKISNILSFKEKLKEIEYFIESEKIENITSIKFGTTFITEEKHDLTEDLISVVIEYDADIVSLVLKAAINSVI